MELDFRFEDEDDYEYEIFSIPSRARAWASVIKDFKIQRPFLHDYDVNVPNFAFYGGRKQATTKSYLSFFTWIWCLGIQLQQGSPTFD